MDKLALTGMALAVGGAIGILAVETVGTAHASRPGERDYLLAISVGTPMKLINLPGDAAVDSRLVRQRTLVCRGGILGFGALSVGHRCGGN